MKQVSPPLGLRNPKGIDAVTVRNILVGRYGSRRWEFWYEHLRKTHELVGYLTQVESCSIQHQYLADIKRQATVRMREEVDFDYLSDRVRPVVRLLIPPFGENDWVEWPQGVFLLAAPDRDADEYDRVLRDVEAYDPLQALADDLVANRYSVAAGTNVVDHVASLVAFAVPIWQVTRSTETLVSAKEWEPGTSKLRIANELLASAEYSSVSFDSEGVGIIEPYQSPEEKATEWTYEYGEESLIHAEVKQTLDMFSVANKWVAVVSEPDRPLLVASYTNSNPASPTSTVRRGRTIVDFRTEEEAVSQTVLNKKVRRYALEASSAYEHIEFSTLLMPIHENADVFQFSYNPLGVNGKVTETAWTLEMSIEGRMQHTVRRVVNI